MQLPTFGKYTKAIYAAAAALGVTLSLLSDGHVSLEDVVAIGGAWSGVGLVYQGRNTNK